MPRSHSPLGNPTPHHNVCFLNVFNPWKRHGEDSSKNFLGTNSITLGLLATSWNQRLETSSLIVLERPALGLSLDPYPPPICFSRDPPPAVGPGGGTGGERSETEGGASSHGAAGSWERGDRPSRKQAARGPSVSNQPGLRRAADCQNRGGTSLCCFKPRRLPYIFATAAELIQHYGVYLCVDRSVGAWASPVKAKALRTRWWLPDLPSRSSQCAGHACLRVTPPRLQPSPNDTQHTLTGADMCF